MVSLRVTAHSTLSLLALVAAEDLLWRLRSTPRWTCLLRAFVAGEAALEEQGNAAARGFCCAGKCPGYKAAPRTPTLPSQHHHHHGGNLTSRNTGLNLSSYLPR